MLAEEQVLQKNILARYERWFAQSVGVQEQETLGGWECPVGGTNNMSYRKAVLESIGGFDEQFRFAAGEDADLKWRICQSGYSLLFVPVRATHLQLYTWSSVWRQARARGKGKWQFQKKYTGKGKSKIQILASVAFRSFMFWRDLLRLPDPRFAFIRCIESWGVAAGEWEMR
jgi:GT2 family glycosyltransferase